MSSCGLTLSIEIRFRRLFSQYFQSNSRLAYRLDQFSLVALSSLFKAYSQACSVPQSLHLYPTSTAVKFCHSSPTSPSRSLPAWPWAHRFRQKRSWPWAHTKHAQSLSSVSSPRRSFPRVSGQPLRLVAAQVATTAPIAVQNGLTSH